MRPSLQNGTLPLSGTLLPPSGEYGGPDLATCYVVIVRYGATGVAFHYNFLHKLLPCLLSEAGEGQAL